MRDFLATPGSDSFAASKGRSSLGYCTNVHAGHDLASTIANLRRYAVDVRSQLNVPELGIGLWLSADAAREAASGARARSGLRTGVSQLHVMTRSPLRDELNQLGLRVFTLNGFPYSNFHQPVVKHRVYEPDWADPRRLEYTLDLITVLASLIDEGEEGSISTLPIGWPSKTGRPINQRVAAAQLRQVAKTLERLEQETGRLIHLDLEPEPGCIIGSSLDAALWVDWLLTGNAGEDAVIRRYLRICHDVCHAAVVFDDQYVAMERYRLAGWQIGKVQISSAPCVKFDELSPAERARAWDELKGFVEPRYLHQTYVNTDRVRAFEDLPEAIASVNTGEKGSEEGESPRGEWRVHFHVPVHLTRIGALGTSQHQIAQCLKLARKMGVRHYEVETYAWTVLPTELAPASLATGIADELRWVMNLAREMDAKQG
ncbi:MAG: metabolite traffic protein EboE [Pyrinomonadaceae bacterium]|nr:metabolite traffic protein EboE [Phycisphaerales bacterium]